MKLFNTTLVHNENKRVKRDVFEFEVSLLDRTSSIYPNQFSVAGYQVKLPHQHVSSSDKHLGLTISDKIHYSDNFSSYEFTDKQMPFVWQSYGKYLSVSVNGTQNDGPFFMWIIVNAIFETKSLYSYVLSPCYLPIGEKCLKNNLHSIGGKYCFSIHTNYTGSWLESEQICKDKGGELWQINNKFDWNEVMRSSKCEWYFEKDWHQRPVEYDGRINALSLLHSSSVMYLKFPDQEVNIQAFLSLFLSSLFT